MKHKLLFLSCTKTKAQNADNSDIHFCLLYSFPYVVQCCFFSLSFYAILSHLTILLILVKRLKNVFVFVLFRNVKAATLSNRNLNDPKIIIKLLMRLTFKKKARTHAQNCYLAASRRNANYQSYKYSIKFYAAFENLQNEDI